MEKGKGGKSSRLKRKVSSKANPQPVKVLKANQSANLENPIEKVQAIVLSSDSDDDCEMTVQSKQRSGDTSGLSTVKASNFPEEKDSSIHQLKDLIYKLSSKQCLDPASLTPFPPHPQASEDTGSLNGIDRTNFNWRLLPTPKSLVPEELPPFPKYCDKCRKLGVCKNKSFCDKPGSNSLKPTSETDDESTVTVPKELTLKTFANSLDPDQAPQIVAPDLRSKLLDTQNASVTAKTVLGSNGLIDKQHGNHSSQTLSSGKTSAVGVHRSVAQHIADCNNSHLMRDRNSNFYSLQSRNNQRCPQSEDNCDSGKRDTDYLPCPSSSAELHTTSSDNRHKKPELSGNVGATGSSSNSGQNALALKAEKQGGTDPSNTEHRSNKATVSNSIENKIISKIEGNKAGSSFSSTRNDDRETQKAGAGNQTDKREQVLQSCSAAGNQTSDKSEPVLQSCPMCQMKFPAGTEQMDIDSHLASCLSTADDDFMW